MNLIQRVQDILLKPKATWPVIDAETADLPWLYKNYLMILALIPALASFVGLSLVGVSGFGVTFRVPVGSGLATMVVGYVLTLVMVFLISLVVDALAPTFGGTKNPVSALKLMVYSSTAGLAGGIFSLLPMLSVLGLVASLYSIYLIYTGLPVLMKCPPEKAAGYTAVVVVLSLVGWLVVAGVIGMLTPSPMRVGGVSAPTVPGVTLSTPGGEVRVDSTQADALARQMEAASQRIAQAQASGDTAAANKAAADVMGALKGAAGTSVPAQDLKPLLPETLSGLPRESIEARDSGAMGLGSQARAVYRQDDKQIELSISDMGGLMSAAAAWAQITLDRETDGNVEKVYKEGERAVRETYRKDGSDGEYTLILKNGLMVQARGEQIDMAAVRSAVSGLALSQIEGIQRPAGS